MIAVEADGDWSEQRFDDTAADAERESIDMSAIDGEVVHQPASCQRVFTPAVDQGSRRKRLI